MKFLSAILLLCSLFWSQVSCLTLQKLDKTAPVSGIDKPQNQNKKTVEDSKVTCPKNPSNSVDAPLKDRAVCPWQLKENYDENRLPVIIHEAVCRCKGCLKNGTCVPIHADLPILRKTEIGTYKSEKLKVAVACNCVLNQL